MKPEIKRYEGSSVGKLRLLWEQVFSEDSQKFTDYYFREKAEANVAFALEESESGESGILSMLHLTPYEMELRVGDTFVKRRVNYIVGVATQAQYRHRGYMDMLLREALRWMRKEKMPFSFLMPASPKIYEPYQFAYIYDRKEYMVGEPRKRELYAAWETLGEWKTAVAEKEDFLPLANYVNQKLKKGYDVFVHRDCSYFQRMQKELAAQEGRIYILQDVQKKAIGGYIFYAEEDKGYVQEMILEKAAESAAEAGIVLEKGKHRYIREKGRKPVIMARIIHVESMLSMLRLRRAAEQERVKLNIWIKDAILEENTGMWECVFGKDETYLREMPKEKGREECSVTVEKLASWMFGYRDAKECFDIPESIRNDVLCKLEDVSVWTNVFINEIV